MSNSASPNTKSTEMKTEKRENLISKASKLPSCISDKEIQKLVARPTPSKDRDQCQGKNCYDRKWVVSEEDIAEMVAWQKGEEELEIEEDIGESKS
ncbi:hypothetical protein HII31_03514 [Pseudocercospora fuligena]|uniref:Uncharacterized protein n=1 Tax=Pseudocercospora fuligena TaxID=685502 RepID=A0A8H6RQY9_9PEZI|nr:hypothetical protein HII31_03514 [Pseudocercospora fuligena]